MTQPTMKERPGMLTSDVRDMSATEHATRVETAAIYRVIEHLGWGNGIYNHVGVRLPDEPTKFLIKKHALIYDEVTASNLVKLDFNEDYPHDSGVNEVGFYTHAPVLRARPDLHCTIHIHTTAGGAISAHGRGLRPIHQQSLRVVNRIAYSRPYGGFTESKEEEQALVEDLGDKMILIMRNHGMLVCGHSIGQAFDLLMAFIQAAEIQLALEASGAEILEVPPPIAAATAKQFEHHDAGRGQADWPAWIRRMDRLDPSYRD
jgi:ribulose-5-phosphate 4-epimerase/fuculose-1-phosphate aldolase